MEKVRNMNEQRNERMEEKEPKVTVVKQGTPEFDKLMKVKRSYAQLRFLEEFHQLLDNFMENDEELRDLTGEPFFGRDTFTMIMCLDKVRQLLAKKEGTIASELGGFDGPIEIELTEKADPIKDGIGTILQHLSKELGIDVNATIVELGKR